LFDKKERKENEDIKSSKNEREKNINRWQTLWVTDMPLFHCGSG